MIFSSRIKYKKVKRVFLLLCNKKELEERNYGNSH